MLKGDIAISGSEQRVIPPQAHVPAWLDAGTSLSHDDMAGAHLLATVFLNA
jgi:hypothetical protein